MTEKYIYISDDDPALLDRPDYWDRAFHRDREKTPFTPEEIEAAKLAWREGRLTIVKPPA